MTDPTHVHSGKETSDDQHVEVTAHSVEHNSGEEDPEFHLRTWVAILAVCVTAFASLYTIQGPSAVLSQISVDLDNSVALAWVPTSFTVPQAVLAPVLSSAADRFQIRKWVIIVLILLGIVGSAIAPGSRTIYRLIGAQILLGFAGTATPFCAVIPSEILPRKWRPMAQAAFNFSAMCGAIAGPPIMGALVNANLHSGWRTYYWTIFGIWVLALISILVGYRPPRRHTTYDHLTWPQKLAQLDLIGFTLFLIGLTLFLVGIGLGGGLSPWRSAPVISTLTIGLLFTTAFGLYEWKGTSTGILHHDLFRGGAGRGRTFSILLGLMLCEGVLMYAFIVFFPILTTRLYASNTVLVVAREEPFFAAALLSTPVWGFVSTKLRTIRETLFAGFLIFTAGAVGLATLQPDSSTNSVVFAGLSGIGFGACIVLINAGVQLATPHQLIVTATAVTFSTRSVGAAVFTTIFSVALDNSFAKKMPAYVAAAATKAGLPAQSVPKFIAMLDSNDQAALARIPGVTRQVSHAGVLALKHAFADSTRIVYIIALSMGVVACGGCWFLGSLAATMDYHVDAPIEGSNGGQGSCHEEGIMEVKS